MIKTIRTFLKQTYSPKSFIVYNNPSSIKIQLPTKNETPLINFLNENKITFSIEHPQYIIHKLLFYPNFTTIRIKT